MLRFATCTKLDVYNNQLLFSTFVFHLLQLQIFNLVSLIIDRLGGKIVPCVDKILAFLPQVRWGVLHAVKKLAPYRPLCGLRILGLNG